MIFVTAGTEFPFDRMMKVVDDWVGETARRDVFAQIGDTSWHPAHMAYAHFLEPPDFVARLTSASTIISHAGMGTILSALRYQKPILVMPRRASLGEQRNEHQLATAKWLEASGRITVAVDELSLRGHLDRLDELQATAQISPIASESLTSAIRHFIEHPPHHQRSGAIWRRSSVPKA